MNSRFVASEVVNQVSDGASLNAALSLALVKVSDSRDRAFIQALCYGVFRYYFRLDAILAWLMPKPMKAKDSDVHALLLVGLYQLMEMRVPEHAAVAETVNATEKLKKPWARGLVNGVLREYLRQKEALADRVAQDEEAHFAHPSWIIKAVRKAYPNDWEKILAANNENPPLTLRVNLKKNSRIIYREKLQQVGLSAVVTPYIESAMTLSDPVSVDKLPGFFDGEVSVQDAAAQLAATLLQLTPGLHVLDACSAPGGKLTHLWEVEPALAKVVAVEKESDRLPPIRENLSRLGLARKVNLICADVNDTATWWDGELFDRILLDVPCSASGVIRRHPDIKLLREPRDLRRLANEQQAILETAWRLLKADGLLLYVTCSIFPEENVKNLQQFFANHVDPREVKITASWGLACDIGRQILPGQDGMDGFYYALLTKTRA